MSQASLVCLQIPGLPYRNAGPFLSPQPQPPSNATVPTFSLLTGPTVTTLGSYEVSEGCERKKGQRWGSLERRGMQAMDGEFSEKGFPSPYSVALFLLPSLTPEL